MGLNTVNSPGVNAMLDLLVSSWLFSWRMKVKYRFVGCP